MSEAQSALNFALKMYGEAMVTYAQDKCPAHYDNMCFWQNQAFMCAKDVAKEQQQ
jgi:hypothetical protein